MGLRSWEEVEKRLASLGAGMDEMFGYKQQYFDTASSYFGLTDEEKEERKDLFLHGNKDDWEISKAMKQGWYRGLSTFPGLLADTMKVGQKIIPGESEAVSGHVGRLEKWEEDIKKSGGEFHPSGVPEKIAAGLSAAPGMVGSISMVQAPISAAASALVTAGVVSPAVAGIGAGALGFSIYEAISAVDEGWEGMARAAGHGAVIGGIMGTAGQAARMAGKGAFGARATSPWAQRGIHTLGAGGGTAAFEASQGADLEDVVSTGAVMGTLAGLQRVNKTLYKVQKDTGITVERQIETSRLIKEETKKNGGVEPTMTQGELADAQGEAGQRALVQKEAAEAIVEANINERFVYKVNEKRFDSRLEAIRESGKVIEDGKGRRVREWFRDENGEPSGHSADFFPTEKDIMEANTSLRDRPVAYGSILDTVNSLIVHGKTELIKSQGRTLFGKLRTKLGKDDGADYELWGVRDARSQLEAALGIKLTEGFLGAKREIDPKTGQPTGKATAPAAAELYLREKDMVATASNMAWDRSIHGGNHHIHRLLAERLGQSKTEFGLERATREFIGNQLYEDFTLLGKKEYRDGLGNVMDPRGSYASEGIARFLSEQMFDRSVSEDMFSTSKSLESPGVKVSQGMRDGMYNRMKSWWKRVESDPRFEDIVQKYNDATLIHQRLVNTDPQYRVLSLTTRKNNPFKWMDDVGETFNQWWVNSYESLIKSFNDIMKIQNKRTPLPHQDPEYLLQLLSGAAIGQASRAGIMTGRLDFQLDGNYSVKPLPEVIKESGYAHSRADFDSYVLSKLVRDYLEKADPANDPHVKIKKKKITQEARDNYEYTKQEMGMLATDAEILIKRMRESNPEGTQVIDEYLGDLQYTMAVMLSSPRAGGIAVTEEGMAKRPIKLASGSRVPTGLGVEVPDYAIGGSTVKDARGASNNRFVDATTSITKMLEDVQTTIAHNYMMNAIRDMVETPEGLKRIGRPLKSHEVKDWLELDKFDKKGQQVIEFGSGGEKMAIQFHKNGEGTRVYRAMKYAAPFHLPGKFLDTVIAAPKRMMVLGTTGANLGFLLFTNTIRDTFTRAIQTSIKGEGGYKALLEGGKNFSKLWRLNMELSKDPNAWKNWGEFGASYMRYFTSGAKGSSLVGADIGSQRASRDWAFSRARVMEKGGRSAGENLKYITKHPIEFARHALSFSEDMNRFAEWHASEQAGLGRIEAWRNAADVTVDFKRMGIASRLVNEAVPFFNPSIQGTDKFLRTLFNGKEKRLRNLNKDALMLATKIATIPSIGFWAMNKDQEWYKELPLWEKTLFWHFKAGNTVFKIPVPFEWGIMFGTLPVAALDAWYNDSPEHLKGQMDVALKSLLPYDVMENIQAIRPYMEAKGNTNFFTGVPIESRKMQGMLPESRYREHTPMTYRAMGKVAGALGAPEMFQSPLMVQHLTRGYMGSALHEFIQMVEGVATGDFKGAASQGMLGRLTSTQDRPGQSVSDFYKKRIDMDQVWQSASQMIKAGDKAGARRLMLKHRKQLDIPIHEINTAVNTGKTPATLSKFNQQAKLMARLRREKENEELTRIAQEILDR